MARSLTSFAASLLLIAIATACGESHDHMGQALPRADAGDGAATQGTGGVGGMAEAAGAPATAGTGGVGGTGGTGGMPATAGTGGMPIVDTTGAFDLPPDCELEVVFGPQEPAYGGASGDGPGPPIPPDTNCGCTRRPVDGQSVACWQGTGVSVAQEVGPEGGIITLTGTPSGVRLSIPPNALDDTVMIRITETSAPPPAGLRDWSPLYHFEPDDLRFKGPVEVQIPAHSMPWYSGDISIYWADENDPCTLTALADSYRNIDVITGSVVGLGWAMVATPLPEDTTCP